jgi:hypothetical protein
MEQRVQIVTGCYPQTLALCNAFVHKCDCHCNENGIYCIAMKNGVTCPDCYWSAILRRWRFLTPLSPNVTAIAMKMGFQKHDCIAMKNGATCPDCSWLLSSTLALSNAFVPKCDSHAIKMEFTALQ